jgi:hypothetical protein
MNCSDFEQLIALYVEEDLSAIESGRVETHLRECSDCWDLAQDLKESQAVFKSIRQDIPDATALSVLRERVLTAVTGTESMTWFERLIFGGLRKAALASIALFLVAGGVTWMVRDLFVVPNPPVFVVVPPSIPELPPDPPAPAIPEPKPLRRTDVVPPQVVVAETEELRQVAIKFLTDDPNIIIYWLVDEKGE